MKHVFSFSIVATLLALSLASCIVRVKPSNDNAAEKTFNLKDFDAIDIDSYVDVVYVPGNSYSVKVKGPEFRINEIGLSVENNHLVIAERKMKMGGEAGVITDAEGEKHETWHFSLGMRPVALATVYVTSPKLSAINLNGSGSFDCQKDLHTEHLMLNVAGSGNMHFGRMFAKDVTVKIDGSGNVKLDWLSANKTNYEVIGSGSINSKEFHTDISKAATTGSGDISVDFVDCVYSEATTTGSGNIFLSGTIVSSKRKSYGSGDIHTESLRSIHELGN